MTAHTMPRPDAPANPRPVAVDEPYDDLKQRSPETLEEQAADTRQRLSREIDAFLDELSPTYLIRRFIGNSRSGSNASGNSSDDGDTMVAVKDAALRFVRRNAIGTSMVAAGTLLSLFTDDETQLAKRVGRKSADATRRGGSALKDQLPAFSSNGSGRDRAHAYDPDEFDQPGADHGYHPTSRFSVPDLGIGEKVSDACSRTADGCSRVAESGRQFAKDQPLVVGLAAIAAGLALGAVLPRTRIEDEKIGPHRDAAVDAAKGKAEELKQRAKAKTESVEESGDGSAVERAEQVVAAGVKAAKQEARDRELHPEQH